MTACLRCGTPTKNPRYCSRSCSVAHHNRLNPKRKAAPKACRACGGAVVHYRTLCAACNPRVIDWSAVTLGELTGLRRYQKHSRLRALARQAYLKAGRAARCVVCGYDQHFEVCHIQPMSTFPDSTSVSVVNAQCNLVALCPNHHWEFDHRRLALPATGFPEFDCLHADGFPPAAHGSQKSAALSS